MFNAPKSPAFTTTSDQINDTTLQIGLKTSGEIQVKKFVYKNFNTWIVEWIDKSSNVKNSLLLAKVYEDSAECLTPSFEPKVFIGGKAFDCIETVKNAKAKESLHQNGSSTIGKKGQTSEFNFI